MNYRTNNIYEQLIKINSSIFTPSKFLSLVGSKSAPQNIQVGKILSQFI